MKQPSHFAFIRDKYPNGETAIVVTAITPLGDITPNEGGPCIINRRILTVSTEVPTPKNVIMVDKSYQYLEQIRAAYAHPQCPTAFFIQTGFQTKEAEEWVLTPRFLKNTN